MLHNRSVLAHTCAAVDRLSMLNTPWPPLERVQASLDEVMREHADSILEDANTQEVEEAAKSNGIALTATEQSVADRAAAVAKQEELKRHADAAIKAALEREARGCGSDWMEQASTESDGASSNKSLRTPEAKRQRPQPLSPSNQNLNRSPEAAAQAVAEVEEEDGIAAMEIDEAASASVEAVREGLLEGGVHLQQDKEKIDAAARKGGKLAGATVKQEIIAEHAASNAASKAAAAQPSAQPSSSNEPPAARKKRDVPAMTREEMEVLYWSCRQQKFQWEPDEEGFFMVAEVEAADVVRLDVATPKGTGKGCGASLGARYSTVVLKWCVVNADGDEEVVPSSQMAWVRLSVPDMVHGKKDGKWWSMQVGCHDYIPSKHQTATALYVDSKIVKHACKGHQQPKAWAIVEAKTQVTKAIPVRLWDCDHFMCFKTPLEGPYPLAFREYAAVQDSELRKLQDASLAVSDSFCYLRNNHPLVMTTPSPTAALIEWRERMGPVEKLIDFTGHWAASDLVKEEEDWATLGNKEGDLTVPQKIFDEVLRNLPAPRAMASKTGACVFSKSAFALPVKPLRITLAKLPAKRNSRKAPEAEEAKSAPNVPKKTPGRQPGAMKKPQPVATSRQTRGSAPPPAPPPPPLPKALPRVALKPLRPPANTTRNAAAGVVAGGQPLPDTSHVLPERLAAMQLDNTAATHGVPPGAPSSPSSGSHSSLTSAQSTALTEMNLKLDSIQKKAELQIEHLREANQKLLAELHGMKCQVAARDATIVEMRSNATVLTNQQVLWENMCKSMLDSNSAERRSKKNK